MGGCVNQGAPGPCGRAPRGSSSAVTRVAPAGPEGLEPSPWRVRAAASAARVPSPCLPPPASGSRGSGSAHRLSTPLYVQDQDLFCVFDAIYSGKQSRLKGAPFLSVSTGRDPRRRGAAPAASCCLPLRPPEGPGGHGRAPKGAAPGTRLGGRGSVNPQMQKADSTWGAEPAFVDRWTERGGPYNSLCSCHPPGSSGRLALHP